MIPFKTMLLVVFKMHYRNVQLLREEESEFTKKNKQKQSTEFAGYSNVYKNYVISNEVYKRLL